jgi:DNA sulfur modification protein DndB
VKGKMGSTVFYQSTITARELVSSTRPARETDDWANWSIEERLQRDLNEKRIREEIVPYLVRSADRFFGSLVVIILKGKLTYEPIGGLGAKIPAAYQSVAENLGFLTIDGGELVALDGQHRLVSLRDIIQDKHKISGPFSSEVPNDDISVIFIEFESSEKTRRIFNKINRNAKPTSRGDNIVTSEDDGYAIVTRRLLQEDAALGVKDGKGDLIVNWKSNTLTARSSQLTTISAVYETVKDILAHNGIKNFDEKSRVNRPSDIELNDAFDKAESLWSSVLSTIEPFKEALKDISSIPTLREETGKWSLLFKPVGQVALFKGLIIAIDRHVDLELALNRANKCDWRIISPIWKSTIVKPDGKIDAKAESVELAAEIIAYMLSYDKMNDVEKSHLKNLYNKARGFDSNPDPAKKMEELPTITV